VEGVLLATPARVLPEERATKFHRRRRARTCASGGAIFLDCAARPSPWRKTFICVWFLRFFSLISRFASYISLAREQVQLENAWRTRRINPAMTRAQIRAIRQPCQIARWFDRSKRRLIHLDCSSRALDPSYEIVRALRVPEMSRKSSLITNRGPWSESSILSGNQLDSDLVDSREIAPHHPSLSIISALFPDVASRELSSGISKSCNRALPLLFSSSRGENFGNLAKVGESDRDFSPVMSAFALDNCARIPEGISHFADNPGKRVDGKYRVSSKLGIRGARFAGVRKPTRRRKREAKTRERERERASVPPCMNIQYREPA